MDVLDFRKSLSHLFRRGPGGRRWRAARLRQGCGHHNRKGPAALRFFHVTYVNLPPRRDIRSVPFFLEEARKVVPIHRRAHATGTDFNGYVSVLTQQASADVVLAPG